jgi:hypothetical protein
MLRTTFGISLSLAFKVPSPGFALPLTALLILAPAIPCPAQSAPPAAPTPAPSAPVASSSSSSSSVQRTEGTDPATGLAWVRFTVTSTALPNSDTAPILSIECSAPPNSNRRSLDIFYDSAGNPTRGFHSPAHLSSSAVPNPDVRVIMDFPSYKPFKRIWEVLPTGEYHLRPPGNNPNMEDPRFFVLYMNTVRTLRLTVPGSAPVNFSTGALAQQVLATPLCTR